MQALGIGGAASLAGCSETLANHRAEMGEHGRHAGDAERVAADPTDVPAPIRRSTSKHHDVTLTVEEVTAEIEPGVTFDYMTFDGRIPGPMIRVRQGDTVSFTLENAPDGMTHNVDMHAVYGTGGGAVATTVGPGEANAERFRCEYPGAFVYHCAVPNMDYHVSAGMFGLILVEPPEGLPSVDREFYVGQHELYTDKDAGEEGHHTFDFKAMEREDPSYVLINGEKHALTADRHGAAQAEVGETVRVFMVDGGPNLTANVHPIGNVWASAYRDGALAGTGEEYVQTMAVPPGSAMVGRLDLPVPETVKLVDHALSRATRKGCLAEIAVRGDENPAVFDPSPGKSRSADEDGPAY